MRDDPPTRQSRPDPAAHPRPSAPPVGAAGRPRPAWAQPSVVVPAVGIVLAVLVGAASSGLSGTLIATALVVLVGAAWHLATGRRFLGAPGRKLGVGLLSISLVGLGVGSAVADPSDAARHPAAAASEPGPTSDPSAVAPSPTTDPTPTPTPEDLADPDDPALNAGAAADLVAPQAAGSSDAAAILAAATGRTALVALAQLRVDDSPSMAGYVRDAFGYRAYDTDRNGCDTRNDILRRDLTGITIKDGTNGCVVLSGTLADPYGGTTIAFTRGAATSNDVQIDHVVALGDAWASGASGWPDDLRHQLGNDPLNLLAVAGPLNTQKGDKAADQWLPPDTAYRCAYVARQVGVKLTYALSVTTPERSAIAAVLSSCPDQPLPGGSKLPVAVTAAPSPTTAPAQPAAVVAPAPTKRSAPVAPAPAPAPAPASVYYANCTAVWAAIGRPLLAGEPGYAAPRLDRDRDGVACENKP
jgi:hypothetical protein